MADEERHTHKSLSEVLGAMGPGGRVTIGFEDYTGLFGHEPTEDEIEGERAARFAKDNRCKQSIDHGNKQVLFSKD